MPRLGQNPMRWVKNVHKLADITLTTIVYIPHLDGYFEQSLDVLKVCLESLHSNTAPPFDLFVFDNGSCPPVRDYLQEQYEKGNIQYLLFSQHNIGKVGAWNFLFSAAPGEYVAYSDSDVYFRPDWLTKSLDIFEAFPETGMVTAQPARRGLPKYCYATLSGAEEDEQIVVEKGDLLPQAFISSCAYGLGRTMKEHHKVIAGQEDVRLTRGGKQAYVSADHFQFVSKKEVLRKTLPFQVNAPMGEFVYQLDKGIDNAGYWRLSTTDYLVHHLGNHLPKSDEERELVFGDITLFEKSITPIDSQVSGKRIIQNRYLRRILKTINSWSYRLLYRQL